MKLYDSHINKVDYPYPVEPQYFNYIKYNLSCGSQILIMVIEFRIKIQSK